MTACFVVCQLVVGAIIDTVVYMATTENASLDGLAQAVVGGAVESAVNPFAKLGKVSKLVNAAGKIQSKISKASRWTNKARASASRAIARSRSAKDNSVYWSKNGSGTPEYVGITKNFQNRSQAHARNGRSVSKMNGMDKMSRFDAHSVEQVMINRHRRTLSNKVNSVSRRDPMYLAYAIRGRWLLGRNGHGWR